MTAKQGMEIALSERPRNYYELDVRTQWCIDKGAGLLDWSMKMSPEQERIWNEYFRLKPNKQENESIKSSDTIQDIVTKGEDMEPNRANNSIDNVVVDVKGKDVAHSHRNHKSGPKVNYL